MPKITYIQTDGSGKTVDVQAGRSVKDAAVNNLVPGIVAECGGACSCATCHVYVDEQWLEQVGTVDADEADMLDFALNVRDNSRLSCQIAVTEGLDGLVVHVPAEQ